ncbi:LPXTG-site transpeptidase (sortase) family protein [Nocardioides scoriae]|uniref:LPXTG-site transpeptidase (Sortase) family protein n=1 Tax=Nocardioides scoriae TaxID=642780 RepID=A0A1H1QS72_9ACTN|nr:class F sortase [Nocardioides scoriae]SDS26255.1 LPXTG-site transpeptidase (sortase) family protein [Nocardioides scoriae]
MSGLLDSLVGKLSAVVMVLAVGLIGYGAVMPGGEAEAADFRPLSAPSKPTRLVVPALDVRAPISPIEVSPSGVLDPPADPTRMGWWQRSMRPGAGRGQTVLTGHTVHTGGGVLDRLGDLRPGQRVKVVTPRGTVVYRTTRVETLSKAELAQQAQSLFGQDRRRTRLVLITCTDWNGSGFESNVVAFARPLGVRTASPAEG